jgi:tRNA nucleotidyltransferase (CCA-adding enzyme)
VGYADDCVGLQLLGVESDDIDVSTSPDPLTGLKFATLFEHFLELQGKRDLVRSSLVHL